MSGSENVIESKALDCPQARILKKSYFTSLPDSEPEKATKQALEFVGYNATLDKYELYPYDNGEYLVLYKEPEEIENFQNEESSIDRDLWNSAGHDTLTESGFSEVAETSQELDTDNESRLDTGYHSQDENIFVLDNYLNPSSPTLLLSDESQKFTDFAWSNIKMPVNPNDASSQNPNDCDRNSSEIKESRDSTFRLPVWDTYTNPYDSPDIIRRDGLTVTADVLLGSTVAVR